MTRKRSKFRKNETHETIEQSTVQIEGQDDLLQQGRLTFFLFVKFILFFYVIYASKQVLWTFVTWKVLVKWNWIYYTTFVLLHLT